MSFEHFSESLTACELSMPCCSCTVLGKQPESASADNLTSGHQCSVTRPGVNHGIGCDEACVCVCAHSAGVFVR